MTVERTNNEVVIRLAATVDVEELQRLINYLEYKEAVAGSMATQEDVDQLTDEVKKGRWQRNRSIYIK